MLVFANVFRVTLGIVCQGRAHPLEVPRRVQEERPGEREAPH